MSGVRKALMLSMAQRYAALVLQFVSSIIIARLLSPAEVGIFSISAALIAMAHTMRDFGLGEYIIQERELNKEKVSIAFSITLVIGLGLALLILIIAPFAASIYKEDGLRKVLQLLALNFALLPFGSIGFALLTRQLRFGTIFAVQVSSGMTQAVVSVLLAWHGFSYMSLAWGSLGNNLCTLAMLWVLARSELVFSFRARGWGDIGRFGITSAGANLINEFGRNAHEFVMGYTLGFGAVGIFNKASGLLDMFHLAITQAASRVLLPVFSSRPLGDQRILDDYVHTSQIFTALAWPFFGLCGLLAYPIIALLFGQKWMASALMVQILAVASAVYATYSFAPHILTATGNVRYKLQANAIGIPIQIVLMAGASLISLEAVATIGIVATCLWFLLFSYFLKKAVEFSIRRYLLALRCSVFVALGTLVPAAITHFLLRSQTPVVEIMCVCAVAAPAWLASVRAMHPRLWQEVSSAAGHASRLIKRRASGS